MIELDVITTPVVLPDFSEITKTHAELALKADAIIIRNVEEQGNALEFLRDLRKNLKLARAKFKLIKDPMNAAKDAVLKWEHEVCDPMDALDKKISAANSDFILAEKRKAEEAARLEQQRLRDEAMAAAKKKAEEEKAERERLALIEAEKLEAEGFAGAADATLEIALSHEPEPIVIPDVPLIVAPVQTANVSGIQSRVNYSCEVIDMKALAEYCLSRPDLLALYIQPNTVALGQLARQRKENFILPGCKLITKYV